jgi:hypothetical protein
MTILFQIHNILFEDEDLLQLASRNAGNLILHNDFKSSYYPRIYFYNLLHNLDHE